MYLEHYGLAEAPFRITPHTDFFFSGAKRGATLEALLYAIIHDEGIVKISGEVGSGKTMLCRVLMERLPPSVVVIYLANPSLSRDDILYALADELGIEVPESSRSGIIMRALQEHLVGRYAEGKQVVVLIDEAHAMPMDTLEEIRLLSNLESNRHKLLQLVLFGQPELDETLARTDMRQLRERITHNFNLEPLVREDIDQYLDFRMRAAGYRGPNVFMPGAVRLIARASAGLTRRINILADKSLLAAFAAGTHQVGPKEAGAAIRDCDFSPVGAGGGKRFIPAGLAWAAGGALVALAVVGLWHVLKPEPAPTVAMITAVATDPPPPVARPATPSQPALPGAPPAAKPQAPPTLDELLAASRPWLESVADNRWFVQLFTMEAGNHSEVAERFILSAFESGLDMGQLRGYHYNQGTRNRYGIIFGDYATQRDAARALDNLPAELKRNRPYLRQAIRLRPGDKTGTGQ